MIGFDPAFHLISGLVDLPFLAGWVGVVHQLRRIFCAMSAGESFLVTNARRVRVIAWAVLGIEGARIGITIANLSILKTNKARAIRFSTLEAICCELDCQPADLLRYVPDDADDPGRPGQPGQPGRPR